MCYISWLAMPVQVALAMMTVTRTEGGGGGVVSGREGPPNNYKYLKVCYNDNPNR